MARGDGVEPEHERTLRRLALHDDRFLETVFATRQGNLEASRLDPRAHALVRVGTALAAGAETTSLRVAIADALEVGVTEEEVVGALVAAAPMIGSARTVMWASTVALATDYDLEAALEVLDEGAVT